MENDSTEAVKVIEPGNRAFVDMVGKRFRQLTAD